MEEGNQWLATTLGGYEQDVLGDYYRKTLENLSYEDRSGNLISEAEMSTRLPHHMVEPDYFLRINPVKCGLLKYGIYLHPRSRPSQVASEDNRRRDHQRSPIDIYRDRNQRLKFKDSQKTKRTKTSLISSDLHVYATKIENYWHGITSTMHLYVACRSTFPDDPAWPNMEYFLEHQDLRHWRRASQRLLVFASRRSPPAKPAPHSVPLLRFFRRPTPSASRTPRRYLPTSTRTRRSADIELLKLLNRFYYGQLFPGVIGKMRY